VRRVGRVLDRPPGAIPAFGQGHGPSGLPEDGLADRGTGHRRGAGDPGQVGRQRAGPLGQALDGPRFPVPAFGQGKGAEVAGGLSGRCCRPRRTRRRPGTTPVPAPRARGCARVVSAASPARCRSGARSPAARSRPGRRRCRRPPASSRPRSAGRRRRRARRAGCAGGPTRPRSSARPAPAAAPREGRGNGRRGAGRGRRCRRPPQAGSVPGRAGRRLHGPPAAVPARGEAGGDTAAALPHRGARVAGGARGGRQFAALSPEGRGGDRPGRPAAAVPVPGQRPAGTAGPHRQAGRRRGAPNLAAHQLDSDQIEFVNLITGSRAEHAVVDAARPCEPPFPGLAALGPEGLFNEGQVTGLGDILRRVRAAAEAA
jgi:hypothetical protein